jgi:hypothetical protein
MKAEEVKFLLSVVRPDGEDMDDPHLQEALRRMEADGELKEWFALQRKWDKEFARKLQMIRPPEGLRDRILCGVQQSMRLGDEPGKRNILRGPYAGRRTWIPLAAAAVVLVGLTIGATEWFGSKNGIDGTGRQAAQVTSQDSQATQHPPFSEWQVAALDMVGGVVDGSLQVLTSGDSLTSDPGQWLREHLGCEDESVAFDFSGLEAQSRYYLDQCPDRASVVCIELNGKSMYLVALKGVKNCYACPDGSGIEVRADDQWQTITWHSAGNTYMLAFQPGTIDDPLALRDRIYIANSGN